MPTNLDIITYINDRLERLENKVDTLTQTFSALSERMNSTLRRIDNLEQRPVRIVATSASIGAIIGAITTLLLFVYQVIAK